MFHEPQQVVVVSAKIHVAVPFIAGVFAIGVVAVHDFLARAG
jgi:hypothetical protein